MRIKLKEVLQRFRSIQQRSFQGDPKIQGYPARAEELASVTSANEGLKAVQEEN